MKRCTGRNCIMQYDKVDPATCQAVDYCPQATPPKSNADKIRAMTDEELARFLCATVSPPEIAVNCGTCRAQEFCRTGHSGWLGWLKQGG